MVKNFPWNLFLNYSFWLTGPLLIGFFGGRFLDWKYGAGPWLLVGASILGLSISSIALVLTTRKYLKKMEEDPTQPPLGKGR